MSFPPRGDLPVFVSASGPRTLELAGRIADGVILLVGLFPEAIRWAVEHIDQGARAARRPPGTKPHIAVFAYGATSQEPYRALRAAPSITAWFPQTAPIICELGGPPVDVAMKVRRTYAGGEFPGGVPGRRAIARSLHAKGGPRWRPRGGQAPHRGAPRGRRRLCPRLSARGGAHGNGQGVCHLLAQGHRAAVVCPADPLAWFSGMSDYQTPAAAAGPGETNGGTEPRLGGLDPLRRTRHGAFVHAALVSDGLRSPFGLRCGEPEAGPGFVERMVAAGSARTPAVASILVAPPHPARDTA